MANFCFNCGKALRANSVFCSNCGTKVQRETRNSSQGSNESNHIIAAGLGALAGAAIATTQENAQTQVTNVTNATSATQSNEIVSELAENAVENLFGFVSDNLEGITGMIDATNIVANVASTFGVADVSEYIDASESANEVLDVGVDVVADTAGEVVGYILDFF